MAEKLDPTWLAYAFTRPVAPERIEAGIARVEAHYGSLASYPQALRRAGDERLGLVSLGDADPLCAWPHFEREPGLAVATAYVPGGWQALSAGAPASQAPLRLGRALLADPGHGARELVPPFVVGVLDERAARLVVANDCIGAGRLFEARLEGGVVWSNRAAAGNVFAGLPVDPDERGWQLLAAVGWFAGDATGIRRVRRVEAGTVIEAGEEGIERRVTGAVGELVAGESSELGDLFDHAAERAVGQVRLAASLWDEPPVIHLSGGRDSRLVAAAGIAAEVEAVLRTSDNMPGEADVARRLVELAPRPMQHEVVRSDDEESGPATPLLERAVRGQLLHDAMRHASKVRRDVPLPRSRPARATMPGLGGEIAHAFYYQDARQLRKVRRRGVRGVLKRLDESSRKKHGAAFDSAYELARGEFRKLLREGEGYGLRGPDLLDFAYLMERFVHRLEVGADSQGVPVFTTPAFIRATFCCSPFQRLEALPHREITARLVPRWRDVPYYKREPGRRPQLRRARLWESEDDARAIATLIEAEGAWTELFQPPRIREMWRELRAGGGYADWETVFERLAFREAFESYRDTIGAAAARGPGLAEPVAA